MRQTFKNIDRLRKIVNTLIKHGLGHFVDRLGIREYLPLRERLRKPGKKEEPRLSVEERLRMVFEELGPTFVKFGQVLSLRTDLLPDSLTEELRKLQDTVPPFPVEDVKATVVKEFGVPVEEQFETFDEKPLAAASIAQVHHATLRDGTEVIVKVQRPGIESTIQTDLGIMHFLASLCERYVPESRLYDPVGLVGEFERTITRELDFVLEARNGGRFRKNFAGDERAYVPRVISDFTGSRVLTTELSKGKKVHEYSAADYKTRHELARRINDLYLKQILEDGFFHADPHPGNVFIRDDGRICFHDFGIVGQLDGRMREDLGDLFLAFIEKDIEGIVDVYLRIGVIEEEIDREAFKRDLGEFIDAYYELPMRDFSFAEVMGKVIQIGKKYRIKVKRELLLLGKTFMTVESLVRTLDPDFDLVENIRPYARTLLFKKIVPSFSSAEAYRLLRDLSRLSRELPQDISGIFKTFKEKGLELKLRHEKLEDMESHIDRASNRLSFSLIIAAIIVGSSIIMQAHIGPSVNGVPLLGISGYSIALVLGLWLVWSIFRSGKL